MTHPGQTLWSLRKRRGLNQIQLAALTGGAVGNTVISSYETGRAKPSRQTAALLDDTLNAHGELLQAYGYSPMPGAAEIIAMVEAIRRVVEDQGRQVGELDRRVSRLERPPDPPAQ